MRYTDKNTQRSWTKQLEKEDLSKSNRSLRREKERALEEFSAKVCCFVDKDWWDCVTLEQKQSLYSVWISVKFRNKFSNDDISLDKWINEKKSEVIINKALFREKKINRIIND